MDITISSLCVSAFCFSRSNSTLGLLQLVCQYLQVAGQFVVELELLRQEDQISRVVV